MFESPNIHPAVVAMAFLVILLLSFCRSNRVKRKLRRLWPAARRILRWWIITAPVVWPYRFFVSAVVTILETIWDPWYAHARKRGDLSPVYCKCGMIVTVPAGCYVQPLPRDTQPWRWHKENSEIRFWCECKNCQRYLYFYTKTPKDNSGASAGTFDELYQKKLTEVQRKKRQP